MLKRAILYDVIKRKLILGELELQLLIYLHENLTITIGNEEFKINRGVPQGMSSSPVLFNIFMEEIIEKSNIEFADIKLYADDIVAVMRSGDLERFLDRIERVMREFGM